MRGICSRKLPRPIRRKLRMAQRVVLRKMQGLDHGGDWMPGWSLGTATLLKDRSKLSPYIYKVTHLYKIDTYLSLLSAQKSDTKASFWIIPPWRLPVCVSWHLAWQQHTPTQHSVNVNCSWWAWQLTSFLYSPQEKLRCFIFVPLKMKTKYFQQNMAFYKPKFYICTSKQPEILFSVKEPTS